ncbi:hypothetical protein SDJN03_14787, partial [Cucurbita argyrosperma subsp. sororia]
MSPCYSNELLHNLLPSKNCLQAEAFVFEVLVSCSVPASVDGGQKNRHRMLFVQRRGRKKTMRDNMAMPSVLEIDASV